MNKSMSEQDRQLLTAWSEDNSQFGIGLRASVVLLAAAGTPRSEIARRLVTTRPTVSMWIRRYEEEGVAGLHDRFRPGRRRTLEDTEVVLRTLATSPHGMPYRTWSSRSLADELQVSNGTVARVWRRWGLRPAELHEFCLPCEPRLSFRVADVVGLYRGGADTLLAVRVAERTDGRGTMGRPAPSAGQPPPGASELCDLLTRASVHDGASIGAQARGDASGSNELIAFRNELSFRFPGARLHILAAHASSFDRQALRGWMVSRGHRLHIAPERPSWSELVAVTIGVAQVLRTGRVPSGSGVPILDAVRRLEGSDGGASEASWWVCGYAGMARTAVAA
jgi:transposase